MHTTVATIYDLIQTTGGEKDLFFFLLQTVLADVLLGVLCWSLATIVFARLVSLIRDE